MRLPSTPLLLLLFIASVRAEAPPVQGTMPEDLLPGLRPILKEAVERSPSTIAASIGLAVAEGTRYQQAAALWPQLFANIDYQATTQSETNSASTTNKGIFYGINLSQPIFQWGAYKNSAAMGSLGVKIAERQYAQAYQGLAVSIREQYMGLIVKKIQLRNARFNLKIAQEALAAQQARFDSGSSSLAELGTFKISVEQAQLDSDRAEEDFGYSKRVFTRLVGIDSLDDESLPLELPHPDYSAPIADAVLTGFVGDGIESAFQSQVYKLIIKQQDLNYSIQKVRLLPKFLASASYNLSDTSQVVPGRVYQYALQSENYQISANWTIFDGFATRGAKIQALANKRQYERFLKNYVDSTVDQISDMRRQIGFSARAVSLAEVHHNLIEAEVKRLGEDRSLGYASQATIDTGVLNLYATEFQVAQARSLYLGQWSEFISLAGIDPALANISPRYVR